MLCAVADRAASEAGPEPDPFECDTKHALSSRSLPMYELAVFARTAIRGIRKRPGKHSHTHWRCAHADDTLESRPTRAHGTRTILEAPSERRTALSEEHLPPGRPVANCVSTLDLPLTRARWTYPYPWPYLLPKLSNPNPRPHLSPK